VSSCRPGHARRWRDPARLSRCGDGGEARMNTLKIHNPANGALIAELTADDATSAATKALRALVAQRAWGATPIAERKACIARFRDALAAQIEMLAETLCAEVGKPIRQARSEID